MISFYVYFSDGDCVVRKAEDANSAYKKAASSAIGRYITKISGYNNGLIYYDLKNNGGFVDPNEEVEVFALGIKESLISMFIQEWITALAAVRTAKIAEFDGHELKVKRTACDKYELVNPTTNKVYRTFEVSIKASEVVKRKHEFNKGFCTLCKQDLFDIINPMDYCEG
jgi:hypothetical protein